MRDKLIKSLEQRLNKEVSCRNPLKYLKLLNVENYINDVISTIYLYTRPQKGAIESTIIFTELICAIGNQIRSINKLHKDSGLSAKTGAFILYTFEELCILEVILGRGKNGHGTFIVKILRDKVIVSLWTELPNKAIKKLPSETPFSPWISSHHASGINLVKTGSHEVLKALTPETHPIVFENVNKSMKVGWNINHRIFDLITWSLKNKVAAFSDIWDSQDPQARATKLREAKTIKSIAERFLNKTFYHLYYYDFRGRKYTYTAYLHEQGPDLARGLLLREDKKRIGEDGFFWLCVSIASNWAGDSGYDDGRKTDKIPLRKRAKWTLENEDVFLSYAEDPKINQNWMNADKPWQFLAACIELGNLRAWQYLNNFEDTNYDYESHLECYVDGTNNGSQHLSALTKDEVTAPHVNLVPLKLPGDLYQYIANHVWDQIKLEVSYLSKDELFECNYFIDNIIKLKKKIFASSPKSIKRKELITELSKFRGLVLTESVSAVFWSRIKDPKERRKIVKRNVMTLPYGGTPYGLGEQNIKDAKRHGIDLLLYLENKWGAYMGRSVYNVCTTSLKRPMQLLKVFEAAGKAAEKENRFLKWTVPLTLFPVVQHYVEGKIKKRWVQYGPPVGTRNSTGYYDNTFQLNICFTEDTTPSKGKQSQGASPNAIHSLDAAHLAITVSQADFPITTIHDSFGCLLADMPKLFVLIRETFVELYEADPLNSLIKDINGDLNDTKIGNLNLQLVKESEYCFS